MYIAEDDFNYEVKDNNGDTIEELYTKIKVSYDFDIYGEDADGNRGKEVIEINDIDVNIYLGNRDITKLVETCMPEDWENISFKVAKMVERVEE